MKTPLVSIIIPTYNRAHLIGETLDSILAQTYTNWECVIVDDGSEDDSEDVINQYLIKDDRFYFYKRPKTIVKGPCACRNYGYKKSKGELVCWFDSDDILVDDAIEKRVNFFKEDIDVVIGKAEFFDSDSKVILFRNRIESSNLLEDYFVGKITFYVSGPLWSKKFLDENGLSFDEDLRYLDDWDFNLRALYEKPNIIFLDEVVFLYRSHSFSLSKQVNFVDIEELLSECTARNKHYSFFRRSKMLDKNINSFMLSRYKVILRDVLLANKSRSFYFYINLIRLQFQNRKIRAIIKSTLGFVSYKVFKKGYVLIK